jgi:hypothetical protein
LAALSIIVAYTRARGRAATSSSATRPTRSSRLGGAAAAGRRRRFHFSDSGSGRRWSSGGRGDR